MSAGGQTSAYELSFGHSDFGTVAHSRKNNWDVAKNNNKNGEGSKNSHEKDTHHCLLLLEYRQRWQEAKLQSVGWVSVIVCKDRNYSIEKVTKM